MEIARNDLAPLSLGAAILGTGGGGDPYIGELALRHLIESKGAPQLIDVDSLDDDAFVVTVGMIGAPSVILEKLIDVSFPDSALRRFEKLVGRRATAILPVEIGGVNSLVPLMTACVTGLPVVDADGMGRAFPTLDRTSFGIAGISAYPVVVVNERFETVIVEASSHAQGERIVRGALVPMGASGSGAFYPMKGREAKETVIRGTMSLALALGRAVEGARLAKQDPFTAIIDTAHQAKPDMFGCVLFRGKVRDIERNVVGGYNIGSGLLESEADSDVTASFAFQNEFLYIRQGERLLAIVPDLICFLDSETAQPATCETLRYGQRVTVMAFSAAAPFRTPAGLVTTGPSSFGLPDSYVPLEILSAGA